MLYFLKQILRFILEFFKYKELAAPQVYGLYHISWIVFVIALSIYIIKKYRNCDDKTFRKIIKTFWIIILCFEIYKQIQYTVKINDYIVNNDYSLYLYYHPGVFPFQFCSSPLYVFPIIAFSKNEKLRQYMMSFASFFILFAGVLVFAYPGDVFSRTVLISVQTMVHHGTQIVMGLFILVYNIKNLNFKYFLKSAIVFSCFIAIALILNELAWYLLDEWPLNCYFISRHCNSTLPVFCDLQPILPYPIFVLLYIIGFSIGVSIIYFVAKLIQKIVEKTKTVTA